MIKPTRNFSWGPETIQALSHESHFGLGFRICMPTHKATKTISAWNREGFHKQTFTNTLNPTSTRSRNSHDNETADEIWMQDTTHVDLRTDGGPNPSRSKPDGGTRREAHTTVELIICGPSGKSCKQYHTSKLSEVNCLPRFDTQARNQRRPIYRPVLWSGRGGGACVRRHKNRPTQTWPAKPYNETRSGNWV